MTTNNINRTISGAYLHRSEKSKHSFTLLVILIAVVLHLVLLINLTGLVLVVPQELLTGANLPIKSAGDYADIVMLPMVHYQHLYHLLA